MNTQDINESAIKEIGSLDLRAYLKNRGWIVLRQRDEMTALYQHGSNKHRILIPINDRLEDFSDLAVDAIFHLAKYEERRPEAIVRDILSPNSDFLRFGIHSRRARTGSIPLDQFDDLLGGAKMSLSASGEIVSPSSDGVDDRKRDANRLIKACRFGQTEFGSFILSIECPTLHLPKDSNAIPYSTRACLHQIAIVDHIANAIETDSIDEFLSKQPQLTAKLFDGILKMWPEDQDSSLLFSGRWARPLTVEEPITKTVELKREYHSKVEEVARKLKPVETPYFDKIKGTVELLQRGKDDATHPSKGKIRVIHMKDGKQFKAIVTLSPTDYAKAIEAHRDRKQVYFEGIATETGKTSSEFVGIKDFRIVD